MASLLRELFYETGHKIEFIFSLDSEIAEKFYNENQEKPSVQEIKYLLEKGSYKEIKEKAVKGYPFTYRKFLKDCYVNCFGVMKDPVVLWDEKNGLNCCLEKNNRTNYEHIGPSFIM